MPTLSVTQIQVLLILHVSLESAQVQLYKILATSTCLPFIKVFTLRLKQQALDVAMLLSDVQHTTLSDVQQAQVLTQVFQAVQLECPFCITHTCQHVPAQLMNDGMSNSIIIPTKEKSTAGNCCL